MDTYGFAVIATGIVLFGLISRRLETSLVTGPMLFTGIVKLTLNRQAPPPMRR